MSRWRELETAGGATVSLRYGLLGLLAEGPASGYDLARRFEEAMGTVWPAQHPKIYAELGRLAADGLIEVDSVGARRRVAYRITDAGLTEVRRWLSETATDHSIRFEPLLRSFFFWLMDPEDLKRHLEREAAYYDELVAQYRSYAEAKDRGDHGFAPQTKAMRVTVEGGIGMYQSLADWARWASVQDLSGDVPERAAPASGSSPAAPDRRADRP
jgi:DNA-binding PadR family transcriptional regulator